MVLIDTERTRLRELNDSDAPFILNLLNQPSFIRYIGDRQVRTVDDAARFIETRYRQSYRDHGYGLYVVEQRATGIPIGLCGFVRRDTLPGPDLGFAFLPHYEGRGYAFEAAVATLDYGRDHFGFTRVLAIAQDDNARSHQLLTRLGFERSDVVTMPGDTVPVVLFVRDLAPPSAAMPASDDATGFA